jgi:hypothetical protein
MVVTIAGATGTGMVEANGQRVIASVGTPANTFTLVGIDTSAAAGPLTTGVTADPPGTGLVKEVVTAPAYATHIVPDNFNIVISHMNRLWFADRTNLAIYYLPIQQKAGEVIELPLNAIFRRGGHIRAMATWTLYSGVDPDSDMLLVGVFRFDSPMSKHSVVNYGGDLYALISTGLTQMSLLLQEESGQEGEAEKNIVSAFFMSSLAYRNSPGWSVIHNPSSGRMICNIPMGSPNSYRQAVHHLPKSIWSTWSGLQSRCWAWIDNRVYFGSDDGRVYETHPSYLSDQDNLGVPKPIRVDVQPAWHAFGSSAVKQFKMALAYIITDGIPRPYLDMRVDYDETPPVNQPDVTTTAELGAAWDTTPWDEEPVTEGQLWSGQQKNWNNWQGVAALGRVGAPRLVANVINCRFAIAGFDVLYEGGSVLG